MFSANLNAYQVHDSRSMNLQSLTFVDNSAGHRENCLSQVDLVDHRSISFPNSTSRDGLTPRERAKFGHSPKARLFACSTCGHQFPLSKTLSRHTRTVHPSENSSRHECLHCGTKCKRKDILDRHIREKHSEVGKKAHCDSCGKEVRPRCLLSHQSSSACQRMRAEDAAKSEVLLPRLQSAHIVRPATPAYLDAVADPIMLATELFMKAKPWGPGNWLGRTRNKVPQHVPIEVERLKGVMYGVLWKATKSPHVAQDIPTFDAIGLLIVTIFETEGWEACRPHIAGFRQLAMVQIAKLNCRTAFEDDALPDVSHTVALRNVPKEAVPKCETMLISAMRMLRSAAADLIPLTNEEVWGLDESSWFQKYRPMLEPIAKIASTLEKSIDSAPSARGSIVPLAVY